MNAFVQQLHDTTKSFGCQRIEKILSGPVGNCFAALYNIWFILLSELTWNSATIFAQQNSYCSSSTELTINGDFSPMTLHGVLYD